MLSMFIPGRQYFDEKEECFVEVVDIELELEHSLVSLSKWESKHEKPFLGGEKTTEETLDYINCMVISPKGLPDDFYTRLTPEQLEQINKYVSAKMTATWFTKRPGQGRKNRVITSELIYYWMTAHSISWEAQHWHLERLLTLVRVCNEENAPKKKMSKAEALQQQRTLNEQRRAQYGTRG